jgi:hypothetical protein
MLLYKVFENYKKLESLGDSIEKLFGSSWFDSELFEIVYKQQDLILEAAFKELGYLNKNTIYELIDSFYELSTTGHITFCVDGNEHTVTTIEQFVDFINTYIKE